MVLVNLAVRAIQFAPIWEKILQLYRTVDEFLSEFFAGVDFACCALIGLWAALGGGRSLWRSVAVVLGLIAVVWWDATFEFEILPLAFIWGFLLLARLLGLGFVSAPHRTFARCNHFNLPSPTCCHG